MPVYIYDRKRLENWVNKFCLIYSKINKGEEIYKFSEHHINNGYCFNVEFESCISNNLLKTSSFNNDEILQIILRCRLLRSLDFNFANKLILAAEYSIDVFIKQCNPTLFIAPRIDSYILDILDRKLTRKNIKYIGLWRSAFLSNRFFLTKRGEVNIINNNISDNEIELLFNQISNFNFKATSILETKKFTLSLILKKYMYLYFRDAFLEIKRNFGFYKFGYREMTNRFNVRESSPSLFGLLFPYQFQNFNLNILNLNFKKNIFIALQVNPESTIDYYSKNLDFINIEKTLLKLINTLTPHGYNFFIKDHPNMFGKRDFTFLKQIINNNNNVFYVPYYYSSSLLISKCKFIFTWSGTVCVQAFLSDRVPITVCSPYNVKDEKFIILKNFDDIDFLHNSIMSLSSSSNNIDSKKILISNILSTLLPGNLFLHNNKKFDDNEIEKLIYILKNNKII